MSCPHNYELCSTYTTSHLRTRPTVAGPPRHTVGTRHVELMIGPWVLGGSCHMRTCRTRSTLASCRRNPQASRLRFDIARDACHCSLPVVGSTASRVASSGCGQDAAGAPTDAHQQTCPFRLWPPVASHDLREEGFLVVRVSGRHHLGRERVVERLERLA